MLEVVRGLGYTHCPVEGDVIGDGERMKAKRVIGRTITKKARRTLLLDSQWSINAALSSIVSPSTVYQHPNGQALYVITDGLSRLYDPSDAEIFIAIVRDTHNQIRASHILEGMLPEGKDFAAQVPDLVAQLPGLLNMKPEELDYSQSSLEIIDRKMRRRGREACNRPPLFPALLAYLGEVVRRQINGQWRMRLAEDGETWEPWIIDPDNRACPPGMIFIMRSAMAYC
jgi:hypothetical protein